MALCFSLPGERSSPPRTILAAPPGNKPLSYWAVTKMVAGALGTPPMVTTTP